MKIFNTSILLLIWSAILINSCNQKSHTDATTMATPPDYLNESREDFDARMEWWRNDKFGMFIHWGVYAVPAGVHDGKETDLIAEWIMNTERIPIKRYEEYAKQFNPEQYDADAWMKLASEAGVKYIVITSKHHDGFALWDSKVSNYDIMDFSPYKKDILASLFKACKKYNIKFGLYHSIMDWHHPKAQSINEPHYWNFDGENKTNSQFPEYLEDFMKLQLKELVENYDPDILWFDGEWIDDFTHEQGLALYQYVRELKPDILINNRVDKGRQGMQGMNAEGDFKGDFGTPEQEILEVASTLDWESCMTMNDTWGYNKNDHNWKSTRDLVFNLADVAAKGGNYLLNVGPTAEGIIPEPSVQRLEEIGEWLKSNGEAIYDTEKMQHNFKEGETIRYTKKKYENVYYAVVFEDNEITEITLTHLRPDEGSVVLALGYNQPLDWKYQEGKGLTLSLPAEARYRTGELSTYTFKVKGTEIK